MLDTCARAPARHDTTSTSNMECELAMDSCIWGYHVFKNILDSTTNSYPAREKSATIRIGTWLQYTMVGHVPRKISAACTPFLQREGSIHCVVTGKRCFHLLHKHKSPKTAATTQRPHLLISTMNDFIFVDFNLAVGWSIRQTDKFNSLPNFPAIWYVVGVWWCVWWESGSVWCECCGSVWCKIVWWCVWWSVSAGCDGILCENVMVWVWWCECDGVSVWWCGLSDDVHIGLGLVKFNQCCEFHQGEFPEDANLTHRQFFNRYQTTSDCACLWSRKVSLSNYHSHSMNS